MKGEKIRLQTDKNIDPLVVTVEILEFSVLPPPARVMVGEPIEVNHITTDLILSEVGPTPLNGKMKVANII